MTASETAELNEVIKRIWESMGGRGTIDEAVEHAAVSMPDHIRNYLVTEGLRKKVGAYLRSTGADGLPLAPAVDRDGMHVQLELLSVEEFRAVIVAAMQRTSANRARAYQWAARCKRVHGVWIDPESVVGAA